MTIEKKMISTSGLRSVNSRIWTVVGLLAATAIIVTPLTGFVFGFSAYTYYSVIPASIFTEQNYYAMDQMVSPVGGVLLDIYGNVKAFFTNNATLIDDAVILSAGSPVVVTDFGNGTTEIRLEDAGITPGTYVRPTTTYTAKGLISSITNNTPILSGDLEFGTGTVGDALASVFLTAQNAPDLDNDRVVIYDAAAFNTNISSGLFQVSIVPSAVAGQNFTNPEQILFGGGVQVDAVVTGPAPNTPGGRASLGSGLLVREDQLPQIYRADFLGKWDANLNQPPLTDDNCTSGDFNYYVVEASGTTTLGTTSQWRRKQLAVCQNGTWFYVEDLTPNVITLFGKQGAVMPGLDDYPPPLIPFGSNTLADAEPGPFIRYDSAPTLPTAQLLQGAPGEVFIDGTIIGYADLPFWNNSGFTAFPGFVINPQFNRKGQLVSAQQSNGVVTSIINNQHINVAGTSSVTLSLDQDIHPQADVTFAGLTVGTRPFASSGGGIVSIVGPAGDAVMTAGAQQINSTLTFSETVTVRTGNGLVLRDLDNADSVRIRAGLTSTSTLDFIWPEDNGANNSVLTSNGDGTMRWSVPPTTLTWTPFGANVFFFGVTTTVFNAFYRGATTSGSIVEVMIQFEYSGTAGSGGRIINIQVPVGTIAGYSGANGGIRGYLTDATTDAFYGYCVDGTSASFVTCYAESKSYPAVLYWMVYFTYDIA